MDSTADQLSGLRKINIGLALGKFHGARGVSLNLLLPDDCSNARSLNGLQHHLHAVARDSIMQLSGGFRYAQFKIMPGINRAGVHTLRHRHGARRNPLLSRHHGPLNRRGSTPLGQRRWMQIYGHAIRDQFGQQLLSKRDHHEHLGARALIERLKLIGVVGAD